MYRVVKPGVFTETSLPVYGRQDVGVTPGGAMDTFSLRTGNIMLGNSQDAPGLEMLLPPVIEFQEDAFFILTGAVTCGSRLRSAGYEKPVEHAVIYRAFRGDTLHLGKRLYGFRTYLCFKKASEVRGRSPEGRRRPSFGSLSQWADPQGYIRVCEGPEYRYLEDPDFFTAVSWHISRDTSQMGMRLENDSAAMAVSLGSMVSEAVATGTVQLTPKGPIILLKHRQTVGGYPRVYNVISADSDLLGQYMPGQKLHFKKTGLKEAVKILKDREKALITLENKIQWEEL